MYIFVQLFENLHSDSSSTVSGYVASLYSVKLSNSKRKNQHQPKQYFDFYFHSKDKMRQRVCLYPQSYKLLEETSTSGDKNQ